MNDILKYLQIKLRKHMHFDETAAAAAASRLKIDTMHFGNNWN